MGIYLRKSISVGPIRFNLSKSGIGLSAGVKGFRIGTGPRGNYVHMGRGGLYYRATLPGPSKPDSSKSPFTPVREQAIPEGTHVPLQDIESAETSLIVDSSSRELLEELNRKRATPRALPAVLIVGLCVIGVGVFEKWPFWALCVAGVVAAIAAYLAHNRDLLAKTAVLFYEFDSEMEKAYQQLHAAASRLAACAGTWHVSASGRVNDKRCHAGASNLVQRSATTIAKGEPPYLKSNIETIAIGVGKQTLHFFPDRVLIYEGKKVGAVGYKELELTVKQTKFIEDGTVPRDAKVVGRTWKYVNKSGSPDRRFKDNRELPICLYDEISLSSRTGLNELLQVSRCDISEKFAEAISSLGAVLPKEVRANSRAV